MKRHWSHWVGHHNFCHPARCRAAADLYNRIESEMRMQEYLDNLDNRKESK